MNHKNPFSTGRIVDRENGSDPRNYKVNFQKVRSVLEFEPEVTINDGIDELASALSNNVFQHVASTSNVYGNYDLVSFP